MINSNIEKNEWKATIPGSRCLPVRKGLEMRGEMKRPRAKKQCMLCMNGAPSQSLPRHVLMVMRLHAEKECNEVMLWN